MRGCARPAACRTSAGSPEARKKGEVANAPVFLFFYKKLSGCCCFPQFQASGLPAEKSPLAANHRASMLSAARQPRPEKSAAEKLRF
jgi:hypothetical protein